MNFESQYLCWKLVEITRAYRVHHLDEALLRSVNGAALNLNEDRPLAGSWPENVMCVVQPPPRGLRVPRLTDCLMNHDRRLYVSGRLRACLEKAMIPDVEFLPIKIIDGTGLPLDYSYAILHMLNSPDCLDLDASGATRSRILPTKADKVQRIVFKNDPARPLFRPSSFNKVTLLSWALAEAIASEGFSGFRFMGLFDYGIVGDLPPNPQRYKVDALCDRLRKEPIR